MRKAMGAIFMLVAVVGCSSPPDAILGSSGALVPPALRAVDPQAPGTGMVTFSAALETGVPGAVVDVFATLGPVLLDPGRDMAPVRVISLESTLRIGGIAVSQQHGMAIFLAAGGDPVVLRSQAFDGGVVASAIAADALGVAMPEGPGAQIPQCRISLSPAAGATWGGVSAQDQLALALDTGG